jgi:hypothetical protein
MVGQFLLDAPQLIEIDLICQLRLLSIPSIARHSSLRRLSLKDFNWRGRGEVVGTIAVSGLRVLQAACKHIVELTLDVRDCDVRMSIPLFDRIQANIVIQIFPTLTAISEFRNLREVTLRVPTRLLQKGENDSSIDIDYHSAKQIAEYLSTRKKGVPMEKLSVDVGCYNSRIGPYTADWRAQRAKGHNPERLFIFTWKETTEIRFEEFKGTQESQLSIDYLGLAKWLQLKRFSPN